MNAVVEFAAWAFALLVLVIGIVSPLSQCLGWPRGTPRTVTGREDRP